MTSPLTSTIRSRVRQTLAMVALLLASPVPAHAQQVWIAVNGGGQFASNDFAHVVEVPLFRTSLRADYPVRHGRVFDAGGGFVLPWGIGLGPVRLGLGTSISAANIDHDVAVQAEIRSSLAPGGLLRFEGVETLSRSEGAVHLQFAGNVPVGERTTVSVYGGPSYFAVKHDVVSDIDIPVVGNGAITLSRVVEVRGHRWGFNAGADVAFFLADRVGIGLGVRVTGATVSVENLLLGTATAERAHVSSRAGGVQVLGGLRLRLP